MTNSPAPRTRRRAGGNASSDRPVTELPPAPTGPAPGARAAHLKESETAAAEADVLLSVRERPPGRWELPTAVVPRDTGTQQVLSAEVNEWWLALPLGTRLAAHLAITEATR